MAEHNPEPTEAEVAAAAPVSEVPELAAAQADEVLRFWFEECSHEQQFAIDPALDAAIERRFGDMRQRVLDSDAAAWRDSAGMLLAAIILLDQFSRNIHRHTPRAFEADALALSLARTMVAQGWDRDLSPAQRLFVYLPYQHSEDAATQAESVRLYEALGEAEGTKFAHDHAEVIERFGRFPSRNATLGRETTEAERRYLETRTSKW